MENHLRDFGISGEWYRYTSGQVREAAPIARAAETIDGSRTGMT